MITGTDCWKQVEHCAAGSHRYGNRTSCINFKFELCSMVHEDEIA